MTVLMAAMLLGVGGTFANLASAQSGLVVPRVISRLQPPNPTNADGVEVEGWAVVRYSVLMDGTTSNVRVLDVLPPGIDIQPTIGAVRQWRFTPGTQDGEPVDWHNTESVVVFSPSEDPRGVSEQFAERYQAIAGLIASESYEEALAQSEQLVEASVSQLELGLALAQRAIVHFGLGDLHSALASVRLATDPRVPSLTLEELLAGLQLRFQIEAQLGRRKEALDTNQRIDYALGSELVNPFESVANQLTQEWETVDALPVAARVDDKPWRIAAARRTFTVDNIDGRVRGIDVECDRRAVHLDFQADAEWSLPTSWGNCELFIDADPGTTFFYYEFLDAQGEQG